jgi:NADH:ubiquinone oxidoreductase subunit H
VSPRAARAPGAAGSSRCGPRRCSPRGTARPRAGALRAGRRDPIVPATASGAAF